MFLETDATIHPSSIRQRVVIAYNDIKWEENKAFGSKNIKSLLEQIGLGDLWMKAHYGDIGIVNIIRQRLKDIKLQRWLK